MSLRQPVVAGRWGWATVGLILLAMHGWMLVISPQFAYGALPVLERPTALLVGLMLLAGAVYLGAIWGLGLPARPGGGWWLWVVLIGLVMRALMFVSTPMLETDYFRYLWDGGVLAHGHNPYAHSPQQILAGEARRELVELGEAAGVVLPRVNHPRLTTIYPPTAQVGFAIAHELAPWRIEGLRIVWLVLDLLTLALLIGLLRQLALPASAVLIYWWNPLLIKEGYNSAHMDMTVLPLVALVLWLAVNGRLGACGSALALAVGAKLWPVLLFPVLLAQRAFGWKRTSMAAAAFAVLSAIIISPMLLTDFGDRAGLRTYAGEWRMNAALYQGIHLFASWLTPGGADRAARLMVALVLLGWIAWLCRRPATDGRSVCERALWIVAGLFLLSPTQYPWYWLWLLPMLAVRPSPGLLVLTATLPLYYLRFPLRELGYAHWFHHGVVWLEFTPCLALLAWEAWQSWFSHQRSVPVPVAKV